MNVPSDGHKYWDWFVQLDATRRFVDGSVLSVSYEEIKAWNELLRIDVRPWEVEALRRMDQVRVRIWNAKSDDPKGPANLISLSDTEGIKGMFRGMARTV